MMNKQLFLLFLFIIVSFSLRGQEEGNIQQALDNYLIQSKDIIKFKIIGEPEMDMEVRVSQNGIISLPLIGTVEVAGMALEQARQKVYEAYDRDYFVNPQVQLLVIQYAEKRVQVLGQVLKQGFVIIPPNENLTLLGAISGAGGWTQLSNKRSVTLQRVMPDGETKEFKIDANKVGAKDWSLKDGDVISIPERVF